MRGSRGVAMLVATCLLWPGVAHAYIGPGAGLSAIGALLALLAAIAVGLFGFVWFPIKRAIRFLKARRGHEDAPGTGERR